MTTSRSIVCAAVMSALSLASPMLSPAQGPVLGVNAQVQQPDSALFQRAMDAMKESQFEEARALLSRLIRSYPDSDFVPHAKLAIGDAWYGEGAFRQAELEYEDFITFFPNRPEVAEVKLKLDSIQKR